MNMRNLRGLGDEIKITLPTDEGGYLGRECPNSECVGYFKIILGTGLPDATLCHCPYCGQSEDQSNFATQDQIEYATSIAMREITDAVVKDLRSLEFDIKPRGMFGIGISMKVEPGPRHPVHWYRERKLETHVECPACTLKYAVYGVFAFCPDCGQHNSLQILSTNLEVVGKMLDMAATVQGELADRLIENALEDCVSAFDGFGRELCRVYAKKSSDPARAEKASFQNLEGARQVVQNLFNLDLSGGIGPDEWATAIRGFQKRHVVAHKMGVVDDEYLRKTGDVGAVAGRKLNIAAVEVRELVRILGKLASNVSEAFRGRP